MALKKKQALCDAEKLVMNTEFEHEFHYEH